MKFQVFVITAILAVMGQNLDSLYKDVDGILLISNLDGSKEYRVNKELEDSGFITASTFKIPNTLIGLETGTIDSSVIFAWDSITRGYEPWNQDHTLSTAFNQSCVWCYQSIAEQLTDSVYLDFLNRFSYGNEKTGDTLTTFWLNGDIRISVNQQVDFLKRFYRCELPVEKKYVNLLKEIMIIEQTDSYTLRAKTGWADENGWFVGYLESNGSVWFFANYIKITDKSLLALRKDLLMKSFKKLAIIK